MDIEDNQLLDFRQAAALIGFTPQRLHYYFRKDQKPPHTKQGRYKLFDAQEIQKWKDSLIDERTTKTKWRK